MSAKKQRKYVMHVAVTFDKPVSPGVARRLFGEGIYESVEVQDRDWKEYTIRIRTVRKAIQE